jgi:hypothetical protein
MKDVVNKLGGNGLYSGDIAYISISELMSIEDFIAAYIRYSCGSIPISRSEFSVLIGCVKHSKYNKYAGGGGNIVWFDDEFMIDIIAHYKRVTGKVLSTKSIDNALSLLIGKGLILKYEGLRLLNPDYFFKGDINKFADIKVRFTAEFVTKQNEDI